MKKLVALLMVAVLSLSIVACGGKDGVAGKWEATAIVENGTEMSLKEMAEQYGYSIELSLDIKEDGTFSFHQGPAMGNVTDSEGTWRQDGDEYYFEIQGSEQLFILNGGKLQMMMNDDNYIIFE